ncbi:MAG: methyl-accepting chemotaxis protein [Oleiphilaceae bacterium]|nr:methyl-accepting chemotaxis protein [Oleiphilaceae bacterium]
MLHAFYDLRIKAKLIIIAVLTLLIFMLGNLFVASKVSDISDEFNNVSRYDIGLVKTLSRAAIHQLEQAVALERLVSHTLETELNLEHHNQQDELIAQFEEYAELVDEELEAAQYLINQQGIETSSMVNIKNIKEAHLDYNRDARSYIESLLDGSFREKSNLLNLISRKEDALDGALDELLNEVDNATVTALSSVSQHEQDVVRSMTLAFAIAAFVGLSLFWLLASRLSHSLQGAIRAAQEMANGNYSQALHVSSKDEAGQMIEALNHMRSEVILKMESERAEFSRLKQALDNVSSGVIVADNQRNIIYTNDAVLRTLRNAQEDLRKDLPNFNVDTLNGSSIDQFHKNPQHQQRLIESLSSTYRTNIEVGGRHMMLVVNPVINKAGERLGTVLEWTDLTEQVNIQDELDAIIDAANDGELNQRITLEGKSGFHEQLSVGLNALLDKVSSFVDEMANVFQAMTQGKLEVTINKQYRGDFEKIKNNANSSLVKLTEVMRRIADAANSVKVSAHEVAQGSDDLSQRTESQASSLEETASSMEEITSTVKQTSENANEANQLAEQARAKAEQGGAVVQKAVNAMNEILTSSNKINDIIGVIDEIAFQTNLLALNAAVEAARAGEQGRGFAVVAAEVRTLSQRSAAAAKEIKDLIRDSVGKVESGSNLVNRSGETLADIVTAVERVAAMINDVSTATREQNTGIAQINQAITEMDGVTQQNAALVEETYAASRSMSEEAENMSRLLSFFDVGARPIREDPSITPIKRYQPRLEPVDARRTNEGNQGAAKFSSDDEWEDF